jgi:hypothetical protein
MLQGILVDYWWLSRSDVLRTCDRLEPGRRKIRSLDERNTMPRKRLILNLNSFEKKELECILVQSQSDLRMVQRCRIILMTEKGVPLQEIAEQLGISKTTANTWRQIFKKKRLIGLMSRKGPGRPSKKETCVPLGPVRSSEDMAVIYATGSYLP